MLYLLVYRLQAFKSIWTNKKHHSLLQKISWLTTSPKSIDKLGMPKSILQALLKSPILLFSYHISMEWIWLHGLKNVYLLVYRSQNLNKLLNKLKMPLTISENKSNFSQNSHQNNIVRTREHHLAHGVLQNS